MQLINVNELIPHKMNSYFFDDIEGEPWMAFLDSIRTSGVIEPIIATQDKVIVSGHQRIRACKTLGIEKVWCDIRTFDSDDEVIKQLIETNLCQRATLPNATKVGRCIKELERINGIRQGNNQHSNNVGNLKSQDDLLSELGMNKESYRQYKKLAELPEDIQQMVMDGVVTPSVASRVIARLSPKEQAQLAEQISGKEKVTGSEVQQYIDEIKAVKDENRRLREEYSKQGAENSILKKKLEDVPVKEVVKEVTVEIVPDDYETLKSQAKNADIYQKDFRRMQSEYEKMSAKWKQAEREKEKLIADRNKPESEKAENLKRSALFFCAGVSNFIEKYGGYVWLTQEIDNLEESEKEGYLRAVSALDAWVFQMKSNLEIQ